MEKYCAACGTELIGRELKNEGIVPYCPKCETYRFPAFSVAVIMVVKRENDGKILLIRQHGRPYYILVAGYIMKGESAEAAAERELREETGMRGIRFRYNRSEYMERNNVLMCNYAVSVKDNSEFCPNEEIDSFGWFDPEEALRTVKPGSLAEQFLGECIAMHNA